MDNARDLPPEVSAAIGRFRMGASNDRDRQVLTEYLVNEGDALSADEQIALGDLIHAMGGGAMAQDPSDGFSSSPGLTYTPGGGDVRSQVQTQIQAPANLPTPQPPPITAGPSSIPSSPNDPMMRGDAPQSMLSNPAQAPVQALPPDMPSMPPISSADFAPAGAGASNIQQRAARQNQRADARSAGGAQGRGQNWKNLEGSMGGSAFSDVGPQYLQAYAGNPEMAAREMVGPGANTTAHALAPLTGSALAMANLGLLGGGRGHGLGGPASSGQQLQRAESLIEGLGPGEYIDPASVYRQTLRRARKTPIGDLYSGQGDPNDINQQIATTQNAILAPLKGVATEDAYNGTAAMLDQEAMAWLEAVAHGEISPDQISYPEYLRQHKRQKFLGR